MAAAEMHADFELARCPRCETPDPQLKLLTSMTRYFACTRCEHRWDVSRLAGGRAGLAAEQDAVPDS
jgi:hypothetical protein